MVVVMVRLLMLGMTIVIVALLLVKVRVVATSVVVASVERRSAIDTRKMAEWEAACEQLGSGNGPQNKNKMKNLRFIVVACIVVDRLVVLVVMAVLVLGLIIVGLFLVV